MAWAPRQKILALLALSRRNKEEGIECSLAWTAGAVDNAIICDDIAEREG